MIFPECLWDLLPAPHRAHLVALYRAEGQERPGATRVSRGGSWCCRGPGGPWLRRGFPCAPRPAGAVPRANWGERSTAQPTPPVRAASVCWLPPPPRPFPCFLLPRSQHCPSQRSGRPEAGDTRPGCPPSRFGPRCGDPRFWPSFPPEPLSVRPSKAVRDTGGGGDRPRRGRPHGLPDSPQPPSSQAPSFSPLNPVPSDPSISALHLTHCCWHRSASGSCHDQ